MATAYYWLLHEIATDYTYGYTTRTEPAVDMLQTIDVYATYSVWAQGAGSDAYVVNAPHGYPYTLSPTQAGSGYFAWDWQPHKDFYVYYITSDGNGHMTSQTIIHSAYATPYVHKGAFTGQYAESANRNAYPDDSIYGSYWYVFGGSYEPTTAAEITYKGETLVTLSAGSATLSCKDKYMEDDVTVTRSSGGVRITYDGDTIATFSGGVATLSCKGKVMSDDVSILLT